VLVPKIPEKFKHLIERNYLKVGDNVSIDETVSFVDILPLNGRIELGDWCRLSSGCVIYGGCKFGNKVFIGHNSIILPRTIIGNNTYVGGLVNCEGDTRIGNNCGINAQCHITKFTVIGDYTFLGPMVCTTNDYKMRFKRSGHGKNLIGPTIGRGVRIGNMASILPGVIIKDNAIIGAGSVVTKDVPENKIVFGSPAKEKGEVLEEDRL